MWPSVFWIETQSWVGTGWLIEPNLIVTAGHIIDGAATVTVRQAIDQSFSATVLASDSQLDIALLRFDPARAGLNTDAAPLRLGTITKAEIGQPLMTLGYSGLVYVQVNGTVGSANASVGVLSQIIDFGDFGRNLELDAAIDPGDSGGPVLNSAGEVIGIAQSQLQELDDGSRYVGTFYALHVDEVVAALPSLKLRRSR